MRILASLLFCIAYQQAVADEVILNNGDKISGELLQTNKRNIKFKTNYAGTLTIKRSEVRSVSANDAFPIRLYKGDQIMITGLQFDEKQIRATSPDKDPIILDKNSITHIYPAGRGSGEFSGRSSVVLKTEKGNKDSARFNLDLDLTYRGLKDRVNLFAEAEVEEGQLIKTRDRWELAFSYNRFFTDHWYWTGSLSGERNLRSGVGSRIEVGPWLGYQFFESKKLNLSFETGTLWQQDELVSGEETDDVTFGWHLFYDQFIVDNWLQIYHEQEGVYRNIDDSLFWNSWTGFRFPTPKGIETSLELRVNYDSALPPKRDSSESILRFKVGYRW